VEEYLIVCFRGVFEVQKLHLPDHLRRRCAGMKPASGAGELGHEGGAGDHRGFLDCHGYQNLASVDDEILGDAQRQCVQADYVLDHVIGGGNTQS